MKQYWILLLMLGVANISHAIVSDGFKCAMEIKDKNSDASTRQKMEFFIARLPLSASPASDVRLTAGMSKQSLSLEIDKATFDANINFYYKHAVRLDANGNPTEARQHTCITISTAYCNKEKGRMPIICKIPGEIMCKEAHDPFGEENGWTTTSLVDGEPVFNEQMLGGEFFASIRDNDKVEMGTIKMTCRYAGTYK